MTPSLLLCVRFFLGVWYPQEEAALPAVVNAPVVNAPDVAAPDVDSPEVAAPEVAPHEVAAPDVDSPEVAAPDVDSPEVAAPDVAAPDVAAAVVDVGAVAAAVVDVGDVAAPDVADANCWYADETGMLTHLVTFLFWHMGDTYYLMPPNKEEKKKENFLTEFDIEKVLNDGMLCIPDYPMGCPEIDNLVEKHPSHIWYIPNPFSGPQTYFSEKTFWDCQNKCEDGDECWGTHKDPWFQLGLSLAENPPKEGPLSELKLDISLTKYDEDDNETTMPKVTLSFSEFLSSYGEVNTHYYREDLLDEIFCLLHLIYVKV